MNHMIFLRQLEQTGVSRIFYHKLVSVLCRFQEYSIKLEDLAQVWANRCEFETHSRQHPVFGSLGQLLSRTDQHSIEITEIMQNWADQKNFYRFDTNDCQTKKNCGFYQQVSSTFILFQYVFFFSTDGLGKRYQNWMRNEILPKYATRKLEK